MHAQMTIWELLEAKGNEESKLYAACFDLGRYAGQAISQAEYQPIADTLGAGAANKVRAEAMHEEASRYRADLLEQVLQINAEFDRVKQQRQEALEEALDPDVTTEAKLQAVMASPEQLTALADLSLSTGDDDGVLLSLRVARQREMENSEAHIRDVRPDLNEICAELDEIDEISDYDPEDVESRFDNLAPGVPSREEMLNIAVVK
jgi:hypothetical protein